MAKWMGYPEPDQLRVGMKVSWHYYKSKRKAESCSKAAKNNAVIQAANGYDFGYQSPGSIQTDQNFYPGLFEVCIP